MPHKVLAFWSHVFGSRSHVLPEMRAQSACILESRVREPVTCVTGDARTKRLHFGVTCSGADHMCYRRCACKALAFWSHVLGRRSHFLFCQWHLPELSANAADRPNYAKVFHAILVLGAVHGRAAQREAWSTDADDARPQRLAKHRLAAGPVACARVHMMLAGWLPGVVHGGREAKRVRVPRGLRARSHAAQWKNEGPMKQGRRHYASCLLLTHIARLRHSPKARSHRTNALGDRALLDRKRSGGTTTAASKLG